MVRMRKAQLTFLPLCGRCSNGSGQRCAAFNFNLNSMWANLACRRTSTHIHIYVYIFSFKRLYMHACAIVVHKINVVHFNRHNATSNARCLVVMDSIFLLLFFFCCSFCFASPSSVIKQSSNRLVFGSKCCTLLPIALIVTFTHNYLWLQALSVRGRPFFFFLQYLLLFCFFTREIFHHYVEVCPCVALIDFPIGRALQN